MTMFYGRRTATGVAQTVPRHHFFWTQADSGVPPHRELGSDGHRGHLRRLQANGLSWRFQVVINPDGSGTLLGAYAQGANRSGAVELVKPCIWSTFIAIGGRPGGAAPV